MAQAIEVSEAEISEWETGQSQPTISYFIALTQHFGVDQADLVIEPDDP